jgi:hypothetical protein
MRVELKEAAVRLGEWTRLSDVAPADVRELVELGLLVSFGDGTWPLVELDVPVVWWERPAPPALVDELRRLGDERRVWRAASCGRWEAAGGLGLSVQDFDLLAATAEVQPGRFGRYARSDIARLRRARLQATG